MAADAQISTRFDIVTMPSWEVGVGNASYSDANCLLRNAGTILSNSDSYTDAVMWVLIIDVTETDFGLSF